MMPTKRPHPPVIDSDHAHLLPDVRDPRFYARRLLSLGQATLRAVALRWWGGDMEAARRALYPPQTDLKP